MKTLGLLGGLSWESTTAYYQHLNRLARDRLGGQHSARLLIWSFDFAPISALLAEGGWDEIAGRLVEAARRLEVAGAEAMMIGSNTIHRVAPAVQTAIGVPLLHVVDATAAAIRSGGATRPLLLATRFTMETAFYRDRLAAAGLDPVIPPPEDRERLHAIIFDELVQGRFEAASRARVIAIAERAVARAGADSVILGCTEFALLVQAADFPVPVFDTTEIHARAAMDFALAA
jgi:aspartate racemase